MVKFLILTKTGKEYLITNNIKYAFDVANNLSFETTIKKLIVNNTLKK